MDKVSVLIENFNQRGWGIGPYSSGKVELIGAVPGDEVLASLHRKRRGKWRGDLCEVVRPSSLRVSPRCAHVPRCGGCTWQQLDYSAQLKEKQGRVKKAFDALIGEHGSELRPIIACDAHWGYRNKMEFSFSQNKAGERFLGLIIAASRGHVMNLNECHLVSNWFAALLKHVRLWWEQSGLAAYRMNNTGTLRTLTVREGKRTNNKLVMLTVSGNPAFALSKADVKRFVEAVKMAVPQEEWPRLSIFLRVHQIHKGNPTQFFELHLHGPDHLLEKLYLGTKELTFKISPTSFFQPNSFQAEKLYSEALKMAAFPKKHVLDLYAGTASLGMAMALCAEKVTAIELNPHACFDAESNKELNQLQNLEIVCGDVGKKLEELRKRLDFIPPDLIVVDPPRAGLDAAALAHLQSLKPKEIIYVSCNIETQAVNIQEICKSDYRLTALQPVDLFPHTPHIENICRLEVNGCPT